MTGKEQGGSKFDPIVQTSRNYLESLAKTEICGRFSGCGAVAFNGWREDFSSWLSGVFARYENTSAFEVPEYDVVGEAEWFGCKRIDLVYRNPEYGLNVPAAVLEPPAHKNNGAAIMCRHGHGDWGRLSVIGDPKVPADAVELADFKYNFGLPLAQSGYTIIAIDLFGFGERTELRKELKSSINRDPCDMLGLFMLQYGRNLVVQQVSDIRFAISMLCSWQGVDFERVGIAGISQGAQIVPGVMPRADTPDIFSSIAPRPLQLQLGSADPVVEPEAAERGIAQVLRCYEEAGAAEKISVERFEGGHEFRLGPALNWFERWLVSG